MQIILLLIFQAVYEYVLLEIIIRKIFFLLLYYFFGVAIFRPSYMESINEIEKIIFREQGSGPDYFKLI
jgi:hypothetical protein